MDGKLWMDGKSRRNDFVTAAAHTQRGNALPPIIWVSSSSARAQEYHRAAPSRRDEMAVSGSSQTREDAKEGGATAGRRNRRWLILSQIAWVVMALLGLIVLIPGIPYFYSYVATHTPCLNTPSLSQCISPTPVAFHALQQLGLTISDVAAIELGIVLLMCAIFYATGAIIAWRKWGDGAAVFVSLVLIFYGASGSAQFFTALQETPSVNPVLATAIGFVSAVSLLQWPAFAVVLLTFPTGRFAPRWTWLLILPWITTLVTFVVAAPTALTVISIAFQFGSLLALQIYRYRRVYNAVQRQQAKWLLAFLAVGIVATLGLPVPGFIAPGSLVASFTALLDGILGNAVIYLPIAVAIAIALVRYHLYDIDRIIQRTLLYGSLSALLGAMYFALVLGLQFATQALTGRKEQPAFIIVISTLVIAALFLPLRRRLQAGIDRSFYRRKYDAQATIAAFGASLRTETDLETLGNRLEAVAHDTMQPTHVSLWLAPTRDRPQRRNEEPAEGRPESRIGI
jgi:hypothetical protein